MLRVKGGGSQRGNAPLIKLGGVRSVLDSAPKLPVLYFGRPHLYFTSPELDFANDSYVVIREGGSRSKYFFADPNVIVTPPDKSIELPS